METTQSNKVFNRDALLQNFEGMEDVLQEVVEKFQELHPQLVGDVRRAIETDDAQALRISAHTLRGVLSNFYAEPACALAAKLEKMSGEQSKEDADSVFASLAAQIAVLLTALEEIAQKIAQEKGSQ